MRYVIDEDGVIVGELSEGDRIIKKKSVDALDGKESVHYESFCIVNIKEYKAVMGELSAGARLVFAQLIPYVQYSTCLLAFSNGRQLTTDNIKELTGLSKNTVYKALAELTAKDLLYRGRNSREVQWYMNPYIVHKGSVTNKVLKTMFRNYRRRTGC